MDSTYLNQLVTPVGLVKGSMFLAIWLTMADQPLLGVEHTVPCSINGALSVHSFCEI